MSVEAIDHNTTAGRPFDLGNEREYAAWREWKLANHPAAAEALMVAVEDPRALSAAERSAVLRACQRANMAIYQFRQGPFDDKATLAALGEQFGLRHLDRNLYADDDGISALRVSAERRQFEYIPYSNRGISWHTDGYYNPPARKIRAMVLHCARPAASGGENTLLDHEILYLLLRDENPRYIEALMQPDVMTIPANVENGVEIRPQQSGPVFSVDEATGQLHMRYTARTRSIVWKRDKVTAAAVQCLEQLLAADSPYVFRLRLQAGQGVICNNVLHARSAFEDDEAVGRQRLFFRARYYDRIT
jgi:alpha-ketoglutarate-dependent taurine dioxygenase